MIIKVDVSGMYPTIMHDFNLHQLTCRFLDWKPYKRENQTLRDEATGKYTQIGYAPARAIRDLSDGTRYVCDAYNDAWLKEEQLDIWMKRLLGRLEIDDSDFMPNAGTMASSGIIVTIDDDAFERTARVFVDMTKESIYRREISEMTKVRFGIKADVARIKESGIGLENIVSLRSMEYALKVIMNKKFGYAGLREAMYSDFSVAMTIVNIAALIIRYIICYGMELGMKPIEVDTDGVLFANPVAGGAEIIQNKIRAKLAPYCYEGVSTLRISTDEYVALYMYSTKNYICMDKDGKLEMHGVAFKSSRYSRVFSTSVRQLAIWVLNGSCDGISYNDKRAFSRTVYYKLLDAMSKLPQNSYQMSIRLQKDPREYEQTKLEAKLAKRTSTLIGRNIVEGDQLFYYYVGNGTKTPMLALELDVQSGKTERQRRRLLDMTHYKQEIVKAMSRFDLSYGDTAQGSMF